MRFAIIDCLRVLAHCSDLERLRRAATQRPLVVVSLGVLLGHISAALPASWLFRIGGLLGALLWIGLSRARPGRLLGGFAFVAVALGKLGRITPSELQRKRMLLFIKSQQAVPITV